jgi:hypothetical protein
MLHHLPPQPTHLAQASGSHSSAGLRAADHLPSGAEAHLPSSLSAHYPPRDSSLRLP